MRSAKLYIKNPIISDCQDLFPVNSEKCLQFNIILYIVSLPDNIVSGLLILGVIKLQPIGVTLRALREGSGLSQIEAAQWLTDKYKPTKSKAVSAWECGDSTPNAEQLLHLCDLYQVDNIRVTFLGKKDGLNEVGVRKLQEYAALLAESSRYAYTPPVPLRTLRLYDIPASAGTGQYLDGENYELLEVDSTVPMSADFGVRVNGDSMAPRFTDRQVVWAHEQPVIENGEIGIFYYDGESFIKKFEQDKDGVRLVSINKAYSDINIADLDAFRVFGKVVG